jgi:hypothetical protein
LSGNFKPRFAHFSCETGVHTGIKSRKGTHLNELDARMQSVVYILQRSAEELSIYYNQV